MKCQFYFRAPSGEITLLAEVPGAEAAEAQRDFLNWFRGRDLKSVKGGRPVVVMQSGDEERFPAGKDFPSAVAACREMGIPPHRLSHAFHYSGEDEATVDGITFRYLDTIRV